MPPVMPRSRPCCLSRRRKAGHGRHCARALAPAPRRSFPGAAPTWSRPILIWRIAAWRKPAASCREHGAFKRVRALLEARFLQAAPHRDAVRRAAALLAQPGHALVAARCTARTVDAIWHAAGDTSADFSWYTKRAILAGVYSSTLLYWMAPGATHEGTMAFLDRRLGDVARITKLRAKFSRPKAA